jgi:hypothetical protein
VAVRARHALGAPGRARRVLEHSVGVGRRRRRHRPALERVEVEQQLRRRVEPLGHRPAAGLSGLVGDHGFDAALLEVELELRLLEVRVERHDHGPGPQDRQEGDHELRDVGQHQCHGRAVGEAARRQRAGQPVDLLVQLGVGHALVAVDQRDPIARLDEIRHRGGLRLHRSAPAIRDSLSCTWISPFGAA